MEEVKVLSFFRFRLDFKQVMEMFTPSYNTRGLHSGFLVFIFHIVVIITRELYKPQIFWKGEHSIALVLSHQYSDFSQFYHHLFFYSLLSLCFEFCGTQNLWRSEEVKSILYVLTVDIFVSFSFIKCKQPFVTSGDMQLAVLFWNNESLY